MTVVCESYVQRQQTQHEPEDGLDIGHTTAEHAMALARVDRLMKWRACGQSSVAWIGIDTEGCIGRTSLCAGFTS